MTPPPASSCCRTGSFCTGSLYGASHLYLRGRRLEHRCPSSRSSRVATPAAPPPARRAARRALGPPSTGAQVIEGCMKKLKDLNKPFKYIGAPAYLREG